MIEPQNIKREDFPKSESKSEGMIPLVPLADNDELYYIRDIEYADRDGIKLYIQLILPTGKSEKTPLVCYVQGSAFYWQDISGTLMKLTLLARSGVAVASIQYRGCEVSSFPAQVLDIKTAIRHVVKYADKYNIDINNVFVMGDSSGGHGALLSALTDGVEMFEENFDITPEIRGIIEYYAPIEFDRMNDELSTQNHMSSESPEGRVIGNYPILERPDLTEPTKVTNYITKEKSIPPILIFHGTNDELVPFGQSCILYEKLKSCGKKAYFYALEGAHHGGREFWGSDVMGIINKFIDENCI